jgi:hypothetical protein
VAGDDVAQSIQLSIEYDPHPPFSSGSTRTAPAHVVSQLRTRAAQAQSTAAARS